MRHGFLVGNENYILIRLSVTWKIPHPCHTRRGSSPAGAERKLPPFAWAQVTFSASTGGAGGAGCARGDPRHPQFAATGLVPSRPVGKQARKQVSCSRKLLPGLPAGHSAGLFLPLSRRHVTPPWSRDLCKWPPPLVIDLYNTQISAAATIPADEQNRLETQCFNPAAVFQLPGISQKSSA